MTHQSSGSLLKNKDALGIILIVSIVVSTYLFSIQNCSGKEFEPSPVLHQHDNPAERCYLCDASMRDKGRLWCREHNRYEDRCWICHPQLEDKKRAYCKEHSLYEDECFICNSELKRKINDAEDKTSQNRPVLFCKEHRVPELECGICHPQLATDLEPGQSLKVRLRSKKSAHKAGVRTSLPLAAPSSPTIGAYCQVGYNENMLAHITTLAPGVIKRVLFDVGKEVKSGDVLVEIHSDAIADAKSRFLAAMVDHRTKEILFRQEKKLAQSKISTLYEYQEAEANHKVAMLTKSTARQKLLNYGFSDTEIDEIEKEKDSTSLLKIRAPYSGRIVARKAVVGESAGPDDVLFTLADLTNMWLELSVPADHAAVIKKGQDVAAIIESFPDLTVNGKITWVATSIDKRSRMLKARAVIPVEGSRLKAGMFGNVRITVGQIVKVFRVPKNAVQRYERNPYLFIKIEDDLFELRRIAVGDKTSHEIDVIDGIKENDQVAIAGTFTLMSEFLKSRLGAGCVDD